MRPAVILLAALSVAPCLGQDQTSFQQKEMALGAAMAAHVRLRTTPLGVASVDAYVENLGLELKSHMPDRPENWRFNVIREDEIQPGHEPVALPGGWIFVPARLIVAARDQSEFAGMLARAVARVVTHQDVHRARAGSDSLASIPLVFLDNTADPAEANRIAEAALASTRLEPEERFRAVQDEVRLENARSLETRKAHPIPSLLHPANK